MKMKRAATLGSTIAAIALAGVLAGCSAPAQSEASSAEAESAAASSVATASAETTSESTASEAADASSEENAEDYTVASGVLSGEKMFTGRDLKQAADTSDATALTLTDGEDLTISSEGVYVVSGSASNASIVVDAEDTAKVQIVLDGVSLTNESAPAIYVKSADKVFVTLQGENTLSVTGTFAEDGNKTPDAVIYSKDDLVLNGTGSLAISSTADGVASNDDLRVTGGTYTIEAAEHAFKANDSLAVYDGAFTLTTGKDGLHSENEEDGKLGYVYLCGGTFEINAQGDGIQASSVVQIDGGTIAISGAEGIEGTYVQQNGGDITVSASDDGVNATSTSTSYDTAIEITDGTLKVDMGQGDTDALDSNGNLLISGGTVDITAQSPFDYDGTGELTGGTVTVNGEQVTELENSMPGGRGGQGDFDGGPGGMGGHGMR